MKCFSAILLITFGFTSCLSNSKHDEHNELWQIFKEKYNRNYNHDEEYFRKQVFLNNLEKIAHHNIKADLGLSSHRLGVNKFADLTSEEFAAFYKGYRSGSRVRFSPYIFTNTSDQLPESVDWRKKGLVTPVKDQAQCGSCWAFSAVASLEGQHAKKTGNLVSLSEQNLVDCSGDEGNEGCSGGLMDQAFVYIKKNHGIDTEKTYPYKAKDQRCKFDPKHIGATLSSYVDIESGSEKALQEATAKIGPISVAVDATNFQSYSGGIFDDRGCGNKQSDLDHGITVVGYGSEDGQDYWLVKNSWNEDWGEKGYIRMSRNKNNQCGIATAASYPVV